MQKYDLKAYIGKTINRLKVIDLIKVNKANYFVCNCSCNKPESQSKKILAYHVIHGKVQSCGCYNKEIVINNETTHGMSKTHSFRKWADMIKRCTNPNFKQYKDYGGRGISVCIEWSNNFQAYYNYISQLEHFGEKGYTLDRIDNNGNYEPDNVRFADKNTQSRNQRIRNTNKSGTKGVHYDVSQNRWKPTIRANGKSIYLGTYKTLEEAIKVRKEAELKYYN